MTEPISMRPRNAGVAGCHRLGHADVPIRADGRLDHVGRECR